VQKFGIFHFCTQYILAHQFTSVILKWSKFVQDKWPKGCDTLVTKHVLAPFWETLG